MRKFTLISLVGLALACAPALLISQNSKAPKPKSKAESQALQKLDKMAKDPTTTGPALEAAITAFNTSFPTSEFLSNVSAYGLQFYQTPPHVSYEKSLFYGEQAIKADPDNLYALTTLGDIIPNNATSTDLDFSQRLQEATKDDLQAIHVATTAGNMINGHLFPQQAKNTAQAIAYSSLARIANLQKNYPEVVANYQKAIPLDPPEEQAVDNFYMARAQIAMKQYTQALASLDAASKAAPDNPQVQAAVDSNRKLIAQLQKSGN